MPKVTVTRQTSLSAQESYDKITNLLETDKELQKLDPGYQCDFDSNNLSGTAKGKQFKADMKIKEQGSGAMVELNVDLPFHLGLVKGLVKSTLQKKVDELLPS